jgi:hypothetical protein
MSKMSRKRKIYRVPVWSETSYLVYVEATSQKEAEKVFDDQKCITATNDNAEYIADVVTDIGYTTRDGDAEEIDLSKEYVIKHIH